MKIVSYNNERYSVGLPWVKGHVRQKFVTYGKMCTVLCDCESTVISRPLTYVSDAADDLILLTPMMFLRENKGFENPDLDMINKIDLNSSYKRKQEIMDHIR